MRGTLGELSSTPPIEKGKGKGGEGRGGKGRGGEGRGGRIGGGTERRGEKGVEGEEGREMDRGQE